jgi:hypothetical protein
VSSSGASRTVRTSRQGKQSSRVSAQPSISGAMTAGDAALGLGVAAARPTVRATRKFVTSAADLSTTMGFTLLDALPPDARAALEREVRDLAHQGREARIDAVETVVSTIVSEVMGSEVVKAAIVSAVEGAVEEVVAAAMPAVMERLRAEITMLRVDEMVRSSIERMLPQLIEQDLTTAMLKAASAPARTARDLARMPGSIVRAAVEQRPAPPRDLPAAPA